MVLAAVAALASGAWAYTYSFTLGVEGFQGTFTGKTDVYLIDTTYPGDGYVGTVLAYTTSANYAPGEGGKWTQRSTEYAQTLLGSEVTIDGNKYKVQSTSVYSANLTGNLETGDFTFTGTVDGSDPIPFTAEGHDNTFDVLIRNPKVSFDATDVGLTKSGSKWSVSSSVMVTPEPTSALLLLLGVAGLALKRKQA